ncbi:MAG: molecular chaperone HtpG [Clostridiales bacterium]|nr:molecular chaperone HtpG [Clostridiales bacterium]
MAKKQFKAESRRLLDLMINSIYTHKEIFLRELISNASDAIDKLYYRCLTEENTGISRDDFKIRVTVDKENRVLKVSDNGAGMSRDELESNLGTIARSGSMQFKDGMEAKKDGLETREEIDIIGQFGVGFYSSFMVSSKVQVVSKAYGDEAASRWESSGADGYSVGACEKDGVGTEVILTIKEDTEDEKYGEFLEDYTIKSLIRRYSDYIRYPILIGDDEAPANSMVPIWKKNKSELKDEDYNEFYKEKFFDFSDPAKVIHTNVEGVVTYNALLYIPERAPYNYYTKEFEKGLQLYSSGVLIMDKCPDLVPDYFSFVKGLVDSQDLSLNISREMLQHDRQLRAIETRLEKKIKSELLEMQKNDRGKYEEFFKSFGLQIKFGIYDKFGLHKDNLKDLVMFCSSLDKTPVTFAEYVGRMVQDQKYIYYTCGESVDKLDKMPQTELLKDKGFEILYCTDDVDEFVLKVLLDYEGKMFKSVSDEELGIDESDEEKEAAKKQGEESKELFGAMKEALGDKVAEVRLSQRLKSHPVCFASGGSLSIEMEKVLNAMPTDEKVKAEKILEINGNHQVFGALKDALEKKKDNSSDETLKEYSELLYSQALLIEGMPIEDPVAFSNLICKLM